MSSIITDPFAGPPAEEVALKNAPLVRVIAQVRFPVLVTVEQSEVIAPLQQALRASYPVLRKDQVQHLVIGPTGATPQEPTTAWRFSDSAGAWGVTLTRDFVTFQTTAYSSRSDFFRRFGTVLDAISEHVAPPQMDRLGVRYIDRISGKALEDISSLVRQEVRGISGSIVNRYASLAVCESVFEHDGARLRARWGQLPAKSTIDPTALEAILEPSWILDLDMFTQTIGPFETATIVESATKFAERIYTFFRWAVTTEFLRRYGGDV